MYANYHTHTWRCKHATGTEREYIENAIQGGYKILGFSDHTPYPYPNGWGQGTRMFMNQLEEYCDTILALKKEYEKDIEIHLGLEVEYLQPYFEDLMKFMEQFPIEYRILAGHYLDVTERMFFVGDEWDRPEDTMPGLKRYVDKCIEAFGTGKFLYLAHPELVRYRGDAETYDREMRRLCKAMVQYNIPAEVNFLGIWDHRHYPNPAFWKIAGEEGVKAVFGSDAHRADKVWNPEAEEVALKLVRENGVTLLEELKL